jgi:cytochrome c biogenesis protein CcdA
MLSRLNQPEDRAGKARGVARSVASAVKRITNLSPLAKLFTGAAIVAGLLVIGYRFGGAGISSQDTGSTISVSDAEECFRAGGTIYFNVTYGTQTYLEKVGLWEGAKDRLRYSQPFVFNASTHVGTIRDLTLDDKVFLVADGRRYPAVGQSIESTTHHDTWLLFLPRYDVEGTPIFEGDSGGFEIVIEGVDIPAVRNFAFSLPLPVTGAGRSLEPARILMLVGAAMAAMLLTCTPCLVGSLTIGTLTMGSAWGSDAQTAAKEIRSDMIKKTLIYLGALVVAYAAVAMASSVFDVSLEDIRIVEVMGGVLLVVVGLSFLRSWRPVVWLENGFVKLLLRVYPGMREYVTADEPEPVVGSGSSSAMGASLAMVCSVAGAPTLTTAIIFPVMIYAGLNDIYWSLLILFVYLLVTAIPFLLIGVGLGEFLMNLSLAWRQKLLVANAFVLVALGAMLLLSPEAVAGVLSAPARLLIGSFSWLF